MPNPEQNSGVETDNGNSWLEKSKKIGIASVGLSMLALDGLKNYSKEAVIKYKMNHDPYKTRLITDTEELAEALALEQRVWDEENFGSLDPYEKYLTQNRVFAAYHQPFFKPWEKPECVGITRLFAGSPELPPFIVEMQYFDPEVKMQLEEDCATGLAEELGTAAVKPEFRHKGANLFMWRRAYRDAYIRGIKKWGVIMEPPRVKAMNRLYSFSFEQVGPAIDYMGDMCAPHILNLEEVRQHMETNQPELYDWFVNQPL
jgi:hypothetical protein